jgi:iron complex transport system substrate-binding protein
MNRPLAALLTIASLFTQAAFPAMANDGGTKPQRIVSINLCLDQLVLMLADPSHIQSLTFLSLNPAYSFMHEEAAKVPEINHGAAEEILPLDPDLVLAGQFSAKFAVQMLQRTGYQVEILSIPNNFNEVRAQIRHVGDLLGEQERAETLVAQMNATLAAIPPADATAMPVAAVYLPNGFTVGPGTFYHEAMVAAGLHNMAEDVGISYWGYMSMEHLLLAKPEIIISGGFDPKRPSIAEAVVAHPAMRKSGATARIMEIPARMWDCAGPMNAEAAAILAGARTN